MKEKILYLILGFLIGAVITAAGFVIYSRTTNSSNQSRPDRGSFNFDQNMVMDGSMKGGPMQDSNTVMPDTTSTENNTNQIANN